jgi:RluA family pseudouridine synthase
MKPKPRRPVRAEILFQDDSIIVVNKPAGVLSVPGRGEAVTIVELLRRQKLIPAGVEPLIVHRLDRGASGVMVLAKTTEAQRRLSAQWAARTPEKTYLALASGRIETPGEVDLPLSVDREKAKVRVDRRKGKPSLTRYRVVEIVGGQTLLECVPVTGRLHQIRVHLAAIDHPLLVDAKYGGARRFMLSRYKFAYRPNRRGEERPLIARLTLHAWRLTFDHPAGTGRVSFEATIPKDLRASITQLRRLNVAGH